MPGGGAHDAGRLLPQVELWTLIEYPNDPMATSMNAAATGAPSRSGWVVWWPSVVMMLGTLLSYVDRGSLALLSPMFLSATNMSAQDYSWCITAFSFAYMFSAFAWGSILDRIGLRLGMAISLFIWMVSSASHAVAGSFLTFALARGALGVGEGSIFPGGFRTAVDSLPVDKQARGIALAYSGSSLGSIIAPILLTPIAIRYGWRVAFLVTPALALLWLFTWLGTVDPAKFPNRSRTVQRLVFPSMRERRFWSLVASYALGALPVGAIIYMTPLYLSRAFGLTPAQLGWVLWIPPAGLEAGYFFWGWVSDRFERASPRPVWLITLMALLVLPLAAVHLFNSATIALMLLTSSLFASGGLVVVTLRTGALAYAHDQRSMAAGIASSSFSAAVAMTLPICGHLFDQHQYTQAFALVSVLPIIGAVIWYLLPVNAAESKRER
jgi:ACS family hexuronate transporter-like MFS transporter